MPAKVKIVKDAAVNASDLFTRVQHYYIWKTKRRGRKIEHHPVATVVIGKRKGSGRVCRGIAICSIIDNFNRQEGLRQATDRLVNAALTRENGERIRTPAERKAAGTKVRKSAKSIVRLSKACLETEGWFPFAWKQAYNVCPTGKELKILRG